MQQIEVLLLLQMNICDVNNDIHALRKNESIQKKFPYVGFFVKNKETSDH